MTMEGIPAGGFRTVGQIVGTNELRLHPDQNGMEVATELLSAHVSGAPVVSDSGQFIGFISEYDLLRALYMGKDLNRLRAEDVMAICPIAVHETTTLSEAVGMMDENHLHVLPVVRNGVVAYSLTRHDLLRAWTGVGLGVES